MMKKSLLVASLTALACFAFGDDAKSLSGDELVITADHLAVDNVTATVVASGHVKAVSHPLCLLSNLAEKRGDDYTFTPNTLLTTCTNEASCLHWSGTGEVFYYGKLGGRYAIVKNMTLRLFDVPVMWFPYWYYPLDTDYGWRVMPGYTSKWGAYLLTKYVYEIASDGQPDGYRLRGSTRFDLRSENGVALGQGFRWNLGDFGKGNFKVYYAWDRDADRYDRHWRNRSRYNYQNWGSDVPDERYSLMFNHRWEVSERDNLRVSAAYYSDSHFRNDFLRDGLFGHANRFDYYDGNEIAWEHVEQTFGFGASVSGPLNKFYSGVARLPEVYLDFVPQPVFASPVNWESSTRAGFLNRDYAKYGTAATSLPFRYAPGIWADYQTFRFDTYHRFTAPFKVADVLSVVPRVGLRGTFYDHSGEAKWEMLDGTSRAGRGEDNVWRSIVEGGVTFAARGTADFGDGWNHLLEPYFDVLVQEASYHGLDEEKSRPFIFDSHDASSDFLDQFAGRSRNLPYSWYGVTPGVRNAFRRHEQGRLRTIFDFDVYAAVQFNDTEWYGNRKWHRLVKNPEDPNYGEDSGQIMPGFRARWFPSDDAHLAVRAEYDTEYDEVAYADISWMQRLTRDVRAELTFTHRNQRLWDYAASPYDSQSMKRDDFNHVYYSYLQLSFEHEICDTFAWGPFINWDFRESELDEIGTWFDIRTDCLGFRFQVSYENEYVRVDRSKSDDDWRFGFFIYLRALGASSGSPF